MSDPHKLTAAQIDVYAKAEVNALQQQKLNAIADHAARTDRPHQESATQIGTYLQANADNVFKIQGDASKALILAHTGNTANPHSETAAQVGTYTKQEANTVLGQLVSGQGGSGDINVHAANYSNPHQDTAVNIGLGNIQNFKPATAVTGINNSASEYSTPASSWAQIQAALNNLPVDPAYILAGDPGLNAFQNLMWTGSSLLFNRGTVSNPDWLTIWPHQAASYGASTINPVMGVVAPPTAPPHPTKTYPTCPFGTTGTVDLSEVLTVTGMGTYTDGTKCMLHNNTRVVADVNTTIVGGKVTVATGFAKENDSVTIYIQTDPALPGCQNTFTVGFFDQSSLACPGVGVLAVAMQDNNYLMKVVWKPPLFSMNSPWTSWYAVLYNADYNGGTFDANVTPYMILGEYTASYTDGTSFVWEGLNNSINAALGAHLRMAVIWNKSGTTGTLAQQIAKGYKRVCQSDSTVYIDGRPDPGCATFNSISGVLETNGTLTVNWNKASEPYLTNALPGYTLNYKIIAQNTQTGDQIDVTTTAGMAWINGGGGTFNVDIADAAQWAGGSSMTVITQMQYKQVGNPDLLYKQCTSPSAVLQATALACPTWSNISSEYNPVTSVLFFRFDVGAFQFFSNSTSGCTGTFQLVATLADSSTILLDYGGEAVDVWMKTTAQTGLVFTKAISGADALRMESVVKLQAIASANKVSGGSQLFTCQSPASTPTFTQVNAACPVLGAVGGSLVDGGTGRYSVTQTWSLDPNYFFAPQFDAWGLYMVNSGYNGRQLVTSGTKTMSGRIKGGVLSGTATVLNVDQIAGFAAGDVVSLRFIVYNSALWDGVSNPSTAIANGNALSCDVTFSNTYQLPAATDGYTCPTVIYGGSVYAGRPDYDPPVYQISYAIAGGTMLPTDADHWSIWLADRARTTYVYLYGGGKNPNGTVKGIASELDNIIDMPLVELAYAHGLIRNEMLDLLYVPYNRTYMTGPTATDSIKNALATGHATECVLASWKFFEAL